MTGGLLQLASSGLGDIYLTVDPDITFFKIVFLKHTAFAIETIEEPFDGIGDFGENISCTLNKTGDLISKLWLKITLPDVYLPIVKNSTINPSNRTNIISSITTNLNNTITEFNNFKTYSNYLFTLWRQLLVETQSLAGNYSTILTVINNYTTSNNWSQYVLYNNLFNNITIDNQSFNFDLVNVFDTNYKTQYQYSSYSLTQNIEFKNILNTYLNSFYSNAVYYNNYLFNKKKDLMNLLKTNSELYYRFAWVQKIGLALIEECTLTIGGQVIDRLNSDILNIWYELTLNLDKQLILDKLIGNIDQLTSYNSNKKDAYTLYVPLPFWFYNNTGNALPTIGLRYHDVVINVKFKELSKCCYFEALEDKLFDNININDKIHIKNISLLIDYVYVDQIEREKFGRNELEYLIEQNQILTYKNINTQSFNQVLTFTNPVKEIMWILQDQETLNNYKLWSDYNYINIFKFSNVTQNIDSSGNILLYFVIKSNAKKGDKIIITHSRFYNGKYNIINVDNNNIIVKGIFIQDDSGYIEIINSVFNNKNISINDNSNHTIETAQIKVNSINITDKLDSIYFSKVQPWKYHTNIPDCGIYLYSYSLKPEDYQPSGHLNMSLLTLNELEVKLNDNYYNRIIMNRDTVSLKVFARSLNIFRVTKGMGFLEFVV